MLPKFWGGSGPIISGTGQARGRMLGRRTQDNTEDMSEDVNMAHMDSDDDSVESDSD